MRVVLQRVKEASVTVAEKVVGRIDTGMLVLVGFEEGDGPDDIEWMCRKLCGLRIFEDEEGKMNRNIGDAGGRFLVVSQFTLFANTRKGNRPSFNRSAKPDLAIPLYEQFVKELGKTTGTDIETGEFGATMNVSLINDGPVTIMIDTKQKE